MKNSNRPKFAKNHPSKKTVIRSKTKSVRKSRVMMVSKTFTEMTLSKMVPLRPKKTRMLRTTTIMN